MIQKQEWLTMESECRVAITQFGHALFQLFFSTRAMFLLDILWRVFCSLNIESTLRSFVNRGPMQGFAGHWTLVLNPTSIYIIWKGPSGSVSELKPHTSALLVVSYRHMTCWRMGGFSGSWVVYGKNKLTVILLTSSFLLELWNWGVWILSTFLIELRA